MPELRFHLASFSSTTCWCEYDCPTKRLCFSIRKKLASFHELWTALMPWTLTFIHALVSLLYCVQSKILCFFVLWYVSFFCLRVEMEHRKYEVQLYAFVMSDLSFCSCYNNNNKSSCKHLSLCVFIMAVFCMTVR